MSVRVVIQLIGVVGHVTPNDGQYLVDYDPTWRDDPRPITSDIGLYVAKLETSPDIQRAKRFADVEAAMVFYRQVSPNRPIRRDGEPNRPLTAFTVALTRVDLLDS